MTGGFAVLAYSYCIKKKKKKHGLASEQNCLCSGKQQDIKEEKKKRLPGEYSLSFCQGAFFFVIKDRFP